MANSLARKISGYKETKPTPETLQEYARIRALMDEVEASPFWNEGCSWEPGYLEEPATKQEPIYAETHQQWRTRVTQFLHTQERWNAHATAFHRG